MKYIDSEKLVAEIERLKDKYPSWQLKLAMDDLCSFITTLQQEQPEIGLEKFTEKVKTFQARYKHSESISVKGAMAFMARMFYQYPNVAKLWYEQLPKATMD